MPTNLPQSQGVLVSRPDPVIQSAARRFLEQDATRIDVITGEDPLHLFFHDVDREALEILCRQIATFLREAENKRIILAGGQRSDTLTDGEVHFKLETAAFHLHEHFPDARVEALFVNQPTGQVERVVSGNA